MTSDRNLWALLVAVLASLCGNAAQASVSQWVPLEIRDGHVLFPVVVAGVEGRAMLDTGAALHAIDTEFVEKAGLTLSGKRYRIEGAFSDDDDVRSVSRLPVRLFGADLELHHVPAHPLGGPTMIIGAGFLRQFVVQLDYPNNRMRLITRDSIDLAKVANVPMKRVEGSNLPAVQVEFVGGEKRWLLLDTGNTGELLLSRIIAEEAGWIERYRKGSSTGIDVNAEVANLELLILPSVKIGPYELGDVPVVIPAAGEGMNQLGDRRTGPSDGSRIRTGVRGSGLLGYELLRHFILTIDYERDKLHIAAPAEEPAQAEAPTADASETERALSAH